MLNKRKIRTKYSDFSCPLLSIAEDMYINKNAYIHPGEVFISRQSRPCFHKFGFCLLYKVSICLSLASLIYASVTQKYPTSSRTDLFLCNLL